MIDIARVRSLARAPKPEPEPPTKEKPKVAENRMISVKGVKINTLIPPTSLVGVVPPEPQPAGNPTLDIYLEGSEITLRATLSGKSIRRACKVMAEHGADGVNVVLQGNLKTVDGSFIIDAPGITVQPKVSPAGSAPGGAGGAP